MEKGVLRVEPNISLRAIGSADFGTRTELKNLNSFRALADGTDYELARQSAVLDAGGRVLQETRGWHEGRRETVTQRVKEEAEDYRYFPEPDLPPLVVDEAWIEAVRASLPELPGAKIARYRDGYGLPAYDAAVLAEDRAVAEWFDAAVTAGKAVGEDPKTIANWVINELFRLMNEDRQEIEQVRVTPTALVELIALVRKQTINNNTAKEVLAEMFASGRSATPIVEERGLAQISDEEALAALVAQLLAENPDQVAAYRAGKIQLKAWFIGQVMRRTRGKGNPVLVNELVDQEIERLRD
jgi:aspartyl-tRNA(Asn)/glutamyl-tRNA(Gln) amidotransferase subunit B